MPVLTMVLISAGIAGVVLFLVMHLHQPTRFRDSDEALDHIIKTRDIEPLFPGREQRRQEQLAAMHQAEAQRAEAITKTEGAKYQAHVEQANRDVAIENARVLIRLTKEAAEQGLSLNLQQGLIDYERREKIRLKSVKKERKEELRKAQDLALLDYQKEAGAHLLEIKAMLIAKAIEQGKDLKTIATDPAWQTLTRLLIPPQDE